MPNIGALWAEMGVFNQFLWQKKIKKVQWGGGWVPALKIPLFQKVPLKEKGYFQKVPAPPPATTMYNKGKAIILVFIF